MQTGAQGLGAPQVPTGFRQLSYKITGLHQVLSWVESVAPACTALIHWPCTSVDPGDRLLRVWLFRRFLILLQQVGVKDFSGNGGCGRAAADTVLHHHRQGNLGILHGGKADKESVVLMAFLHLGGIPLLVLCNPNDLRGTGLAGNLIRSAPATGPSGS